MTTEQILLVVGAVSLGIVQIITAWRGEAKTQAVEAKTQAVEAKTQAVEAKTQAVERHARAARKEARAAKVRSIANGKQQAAANAQLAKIADQTNGGFEELQKLLGEAKEEIKRLNALHSPPQ